MPPVRFGYKTEGTMIEGSVDFPRRYHETLEQIRLAEAAGFDSIGVSDQHFNAPMAAIPQPDLFLACASVQTSRVAIRTHTNTITTKHPLQIAESMATLDILSGGRLEMGTGRGNNLDAFGAFGVDYDTSYERYIEALQVIVGAWESEEKFSFEGTFFSIPPVRVTPKPVQLPMPPIWYAALSPQSHTNAGELGLGLFTGTDGRPVERIAERLNLYRKASKDPRPVANYPLLENITFLVGGHCDVSNARAREVAEGPFIEWITEATSMYEQTVTSRNSGVSFEHARSRYRYEELNENFHFISGDPDFWIEKLEQLIALGVDEVDVNFHGIPHADIVRAIDLLGKHVLPHFRGRSTRG